VAILLKDRLAGRTLVGSKMGVAILLRDRLDGSTLAGSKMGIADILAVVLPAGG